MLRLNVYLVSVLILPFVLHARTVPAQVTTASIAGSVHDESGGAVPRAALRAHNTESGLKRETYSDNAGRYRFEGLPVGRYELRVEMSGFQTNVWKEIQLEVGDTAIHDFTLKVSPITIELNVTDSAPLVNFNSSELSYLVDEKKMQDLPLNGRNFTDLALLQPGVQAFRNRQRGSIVALGLQMSINGQDGRSNVYLLDGNLINNITNGPAASAAGTALGVEAIREFRVETNAYSAEFGHNQGGQITAITKSGTNDLHGSVFEFHRNDNLDARNFFDREKPEFKRNQFGFALGGPLRRDRTHFFTTYEGLRENLGRTIISNSPTASARTVARAEVKPYLDLYPLPNGADVGGGLGQYIWVHPERTEVDYFQIRLDHQLSPRDLLFGRYTIDDANQQRATAFPQFPNPFLSRGQYYTQEYRRVLSPTAVNTARFGFSRTRIGQNVAANTAQPVSAFIPGRSIMGDIDIGGLPRLGPQATVDFRGIQNVSAYSDDVSLVRGAHTFKFGALVERYQDNVFNPTFSLGIFTFTDLTAFLENRPLRFIGMTPASVFDRYWRWTLYAFYAQDEFRVHPDLTLNLGMRYEHSTVPRDRQGRDATLERITDANTTVGYPYHHASWRKFAPRFGFAWAPWGSSRMSLRGGFGIYYNTNLQQNVVATIGNLPAAERVVIPSPTFPVATFRPGLGRSVRPIEFDLHTPNALVWNLNVQREIDRNTVVTLGYAGSRGIHLMRGGDVNTVVPQTRSDGTLFFPPGAARPNTAWGTIELRRGDGDSWYNALVTEIRRRFAGDHQYQVSYTFSRTIDTTQGGTFFSDSTSSTVLAFPDFGPLDYNRGLSDFHAAHNVTVNYTWDIPVGSGLAGAARALASGWQLGGIFNAQSGHPLTPFIQGNRSRSGWGPSINPATGFDRPSVVAGRTGIVTGDPNAYFDRTAFVLPAAGTLGNVGRNSFIGPGLATFDLSLVKRFRIFERVGGQFRAEFFNLANRANFGPPDLIAFAGARDGESVLPSFGRIRETVTSSRQIQFGLKLTF